MPARVLAASLPAKLETSASHSVPGSRAADPHSRTPVVPAAPSSRHRRPRPCLQRVCLHCLSKPCSSRWSKPASAPRAWGRSLAGLSPCTRSRMEVGRRLHRPREEEQRLQMQVMLQLLRWPRRLLPSQCPVGTAQHSNCLCQPQNRSGTIANSLHDTSCQSQ
eukprot:1076421-Rhodomonas_salina.1